MNFVLLTLTILCVLVAAACVLGYLVLQQGGRVLLRLEVVEEGLTQLQQSRRALPRSREAAEEDGRAGQRLASLPLGQPAPEW